MGGLYADSGTSCWNKRRESLIMQMSETHITVKELLPIVMAVAVWGHLWKGAMVSCRCDNMAVVTIVNSGRSKMDRAMHLMRCLSVFLARWDVSLVFQHIPGPAVRKLELEPETCGCIAPPPPATPCT